MKLCLLALGRLLGRKLPLSSHDGCAKPCVVCCVNGAKVQSDSMVTNVIFGNHKNHIFVILHFVDYQCVRP